MMKTTQTSIGQAIEAAKNIFGPKEKPEQEALGDHAAETRTNITELDLKNHQSDIEATTSNAIENTVLRNTDEAMEITSSAVPKITGTVDAVTGSNFTQGAENITKDIQAFTQDEKFRTQYGSTAKKVHEALQDEKKAHEVAKAINTFQAASEKINEKRSIWNKFGLTVSKKMTAKERADQIHEFFTEENEKTGKIQLISKKKLGKKQFKRLKQIGTDINQHGIIKGTARTIAQTLGMKATHTLAQKHFEAFETYHAASTVMENMEDIHQEADQLIDENTDKVVETANQAKDAKNKAGKTINIIRENSTGVYAITRAKEAFRKDIKKDGNKVLKNFSKTMNTPSAQKALVPQLQNTYTKALEKAMKDPKNGAALIKGIETNKIPGVSLKKFGKLKLLEVSIVAVKQQFFPDKMANQTQEPVSTANLVAETVLPVYGSYKAIGRAMDENNQNPMYAKALDVGLNIAGDGLFALGLLATPFSAGGSAIAGAAARTSLTGIGKGMLRKSLTKEAIKNTAKGAGKLAKETAIGVGKLTVASEALKFAFDKAIDVALPEKKALVQMAVNQKNQIIKNYAPGASIIRSALAA